jgi:hypothetical protein
MFYPAERKKVDSSCDGQKQACNAGFGMLCVVEKLRRKGLNESERRVRVARTNFVTDWQSSSFARNAATTPCR